MKSKMVLSRKLCALSKEEAHAMTGGGIIDTLHCMRDTLMNGAGAVRTLVLGVTIWGMARMVGIATGCSQ